MEQRVLVLERGRGGGFVSIFANAVHPRYQPRCVQALGDQLGVGGCVCGDCTVFCWLSDSSSCELLGSSLRVGDADPGCRSATAAPPEMMVSAGAGVAERVVDEAFGSVYSLARWLGKASKS